MTNIVAVGIIIKWLKIATYIGDWSSGMIGVSKTFGGGSIPSSPVGLKIRKALINKALRIFYCFKIMFTNVYKCLQNVLDNFSYLSISYILKICDSRLV